MRPNYRNCSDGAGDVSSTFNGCALKSAGCVEATGDSPFVGDGAAAVADSSVNIDLLATLPEVVGVTLLSALVVVATGLGVTAAIERVGKFD